MKINYVVVFKSLLDHYKKSGKTEQYNKLHTLLKGIIEKNNGISEQEKLQYEEALLNE